MYSVMMYSYILVYFNKNINVFYKSMKKIWNKVDGVCECIPKYVIQLGKLRWLIEYINVGYGNLLVIIFSLIFRNFFFIFT